ncbi:tRNA (adenine-N(1)-)-methyltransferase catalytic subunit trm61 [Thecaphora frezii]
MPSLVAPGPSTVRDNGRYIRAGDLVIVFASRDKTPIPLTVTPGEFLSNVFGHFSHDDMIGMPYGSKMISRNKRGYLYLLRPTPEIWTMALPHRTQILYAPDMSFITMKLNLGPGSRVIEAGTGSGSFSHFLGRTVGRGSAVTSNVQETRPEAVAGRGQVVKNWKGLPNEMQNLSRGTRDPTRSTEAEDTAAALAGDAQNGRTASMIDGTVPEMEGKLWSFEFHAGRAEKARAEFAAHGLDRVATLTHRNVCKDGFGLSDAADAVFLDLPAPWEAVPFATTALRRKTLGRICCFSPCIEQVLKTVTALMENGFTDIETYESLVRTHESMSAGPEVTIDEAIDRIKEVEKRKEARRLTQIEKARLDKRSEDADAARSDSAQPSDAALPGNDSRGDAGETSDEPAKKRKRPAHDASESEDQATESTNGKASAIAITKRKARQLQQQKQQSTPFQAATVYSRPYHEMRGHTSYLTFATLLPRDMEKATVALS